VWITLSSGTSNFLWISSMQVNGPVTNPDP
jgi:hypothetical protein